MDRRAFLQLLSTGAIGAATYDIDKLLWVPGQKTIFLPSTSPAYIDLSSSLAEIAYEALQVFNSRLREPHWQAQDGYAALAPRLANGVYGDPGLSDWKEVTCAIHPERPSHMLRQDTVVPAMYALADVFRAKQYQTFGILKPDIPISGSDLDSDIAVATDPKRGVSIRARRWVDFFAGKRMLAFDVVGGA